MYLYKTVQLSFFREIDSYLKTQGEDNWELVSVVGHIVPGQYNTIYTLFLKKELTQAQAQFSDAHS
jgi:hypothetical protein